MATIASASILIHETWQPRIHFAVTCSDPLAYVQGLPPTRVTRGPFYVTHGSGSEWEWQLQGGMVWEWARKSNLQICL